MQSPKPIILGELPIDIKIQKLKKIAIEQYNFMQYSQYLGTSHWKEKRQEVFIKQGKCCRICGSDQNINIHHRRYKHDGKSILYKELNQNLLVICRDCHGLWHKLHGFQKIPFPHLRWMLQAGIPKILVFQYPHLNKKQLLKIVAGKLEATEKRCNSAHDHQAVIMEINQQGVMPTPRL